MTAPNVSPATICFCTRNKKSNAGIAKHGEMENYDDDFPDSIMIINVDAVLECVAPLLLQWKNKGKV